MGEEKPRGRSRRVRKALGGAARRTGLAKASRGGSPAQRSLIRYPVPEQAEAIQVGIEWAQLAMSEGDWKEAIRRWRQLLDNYGPSVSSRVYKGLANSYIEDGSIGTAAAVIERGRALFPYSVDLPLVWAHIATVEEDWEEAIQRYLQVLAAGGASVSWRPYKGIVAAYLKLGDFANAESAADDGLRNFPDNVDVAAAWAAIPFKAEDWEEAIERWNQVVDRFGSTAHWRAFLSLAVSYARTGNLDKAAELIERGRSLYPDEVILAIHSAEVAMTRREWPVAVDRWQKVLDLQIRERDATVRGMLLPRRGGVWNWYEEAWQQITDEWGRIEPHLTTAPSPLLFRSLALTMKNAELPDEALKILEFGKATHPDDSWLEFDLAVTGLESRGIAGQATATATTSSSVEQSGRSERFLSDVYRNRVAPTSRASVDPIDAGGPVAALCAENAGVLAHFHPSLERETDELGPIHIIRIPAGSSVELQLKAGRYFSAQTIARRVTDVSQRDRWEETTSAADVLLGQARVAANALGSRFDDPPFLTADAYADAALNFLFQELCVYEPMRRIAADIAAESDDSPVFIESPVDSYRYLDDSPFTHFDVIFLYFELRRRGLNAFLCRIHTGELPPVEPLRVTPGVRSLIPQMDASGSSTVRTERALFPAGIRSVRRVGEVLGDPFVFSSGSVVMEFAYDRSLRQASPIDPDGSVHPPFSTLPQFEFAVTAVAALKGIPLIPEAGLDIDARVEVSEAIGRDWLFWVDHALHGYYKEISMRTFAEVSARGIKEAHVSDHLYPDAVLFADAVKRSGGRVVLWPHSANPALINQRRRETFDEAHAVTRSGCELWKSRFPEATVKHTPSVMLDPATRSARVDPERPLSVVVIGGRTVLRYMPELDQGLHEASYRTFFRGIEDLQRRHPIDLFFKPRGFTGEHEMWLARTVGTAGNWRRVLEHPLRIDLPNPLFVSISMSTSALIEGLGRGIPGLIVRDFPVRDYTTLDEETFPIGTASSALGVIRSLIEPNAYEQLLEKELTYYATEVQDVGSD